MGVGIELGVGYDGTKVLFIQTNAESIYKGCLSHPEKGTPKYPKSKFKQSENANIVPNPLLLVLRNAFCYPSDISNFLLIVSLFHKTKTRPTYLLAQFNPRVHHSMCELPRESQLRYFHLLGIKHIFQALAFAITTRLVRNA
jgi:hypothetical protein